MSLTLPSCSSIYLSLELRSARHEWNSQKSETKSLRKVRKRLFQMYSLQLCHQNSSVDQQTCKVSVLAYVITYIYKYVIIIYVYICKLFIFYSSDTVTSNRWIVLSVGIRRYAKWRLNTKQSWKTSDASTRRSRLNKNPKNAKNDESCFNNAKGEKKKKN